MTGHLQALCVRYSPPSQPSRFIDAEGDVRVDGMAATLDAWFRPSMAWKLATNAALCGSAVKWCPRRLATRSASLVHGRLGRKVG